jgi:cell division protein FtsB
VPPQRDVRPRPVLTGRALVLGAVVVLLVVLLASPIHRYLASRGAISGASGQLQQDQKTLRDLQHQQAQYGDPGYLEQQARVRLQYAMPGDTVYVVVGQGHSSDLAATSGGKNKPPTGEAWNDRLMASVRAAGK